MGTRGSRVTSWRMISSGKIGANASGPTGSRVAGFSGGSSPNGRSGTRLYQLSGRAFSSSRNLVVSIAKPPVFQLVSISACQHFSLSAFQLVSISACQHFSLSAYKLSRHRQIQRFSKQLISRRVEKQVADGL